MELDNGWLWIALLAVVVISCVVVDAVQGNKVKNRQMASNGYDDVREGMSSDDVSRLMGRPSIVTRDGCTVRCVYEGLHGDLEVILDSSGTVIGKRTLRTSEA